MERRRLSRFSRLVIGAAVLGVLVGDVVVLPHLDHARSVRAAAQRRAAYLRHVRPPLDAVYLAAKPLEEALAQQATGSTDGIDLAARDVLAHNTATAGFAAGVKSFDAVVPPKDERATAAVISAHLKAIAADDQGFTTLASADGQTLADAFLTGEFAKLTDDIIALNNDLTTAFGAAHEAPPRLPDTAPPSHDSWLFGVDVACLTGEKELAGTVNDPNEPLAQVRKDLTAAIAAGKATNAALRAVVVPPGDAQASALVGRVGVLDRVLAADAALLAAVQAQDAAGAAAALRQGSQLQGDLAAVGKAFTAYGATVCGSFYSTSDSPSSGGTTGGGSGGTPA